MIILFIALIGIAINLWGLIAVVLGHKTTCSLWISYASYSIHLVINGYITGNILLLLIKKKEQYDYHLLKWLSVYTLSAVMANLQNFVMNIPALITLHALGFILISLIPLLAIQCPCNCKASFEKNITTLRQFLNNFTQFNKWLRIFTVIFYVLAMTGAILALLAVQLEWFTLNFEPSGVLEDLIETKDDFKEALEDVQNELQKVSELPSELDSCPVFISVIVGAFALSAAPGAGPAAGQAAATTARLGKFIAQMAKKAYKYKRQFKQLYDHVSNLTQIERDVKKPLVVAMSIQNFHIVSKNILWYDLLNGALSLIKMYFVLD